MYKLTASAAALVLLAGCAPSGDDTHQELDPSLARAVDGSPEAIGMLAFLNDASTDYDLLDGDVGLDKRAARSLMHARNGADGVFGTSDDAPFTTIDEVDACWYVGASALQKIEDWAVDNGWVALDEGDHLGTWDGVDFTLGEAEAVLALANDTGEAYLDDDVALNSRAVDSILDARPIESIEELAGLYYVGTSALTKLKDAAGWEPACDVEGWEVEYIYDEGDGAWREQLPAEYVAIVDEVLENQEWCESGNENEVHFVKATVDWFECEAHGYTIELGQGMLEYPSIDWYIEFSVDAEFDWYISACEV